MTIDLESRGIDREIIAVRVRADLSQGRPATEKIKRSRQIRSEGSNRSRTTQIQRTDLER